MSARCSFAAAAVVAISLGASTGSAEPVPVPEVGSLIRIEVTVGPSDEDYHQKLEGRVLHSDDRTLTLGSRSGGDPGTFTVSRERITGIEVRSGGPNRALGATIGFGLGFATGALLGLTSDVEVSEHCGDALFAICPDETSLRAMSAVGTGLAVGLLGAVVGAAVAPERWTPVIATDLRNESHVAVAVAF